MDKDADLLAAQVGDAHRRASGQVPGLGRTPRRAEVPAAVQQVAVDGTDPRLAVRGDRRYRQRAHAAAGGGQLRGGQASLARSDDRLQVLGRPRQRGVEQGLHFRKLIVGLEHGTVPYPQDPRPILLHTLRLAACSSAYRKLFG
jgi:hypothetical protein